MVKLFVLFCLYASLIGCKTFGAIDNYFYKTIDPNGALEEKQNKQQKWDPQADMEKQNTYFNKQSDAVDKRIANIENKASSDLGKQAGGL